MTSITFDTLAFTEELAAAGVPEQQAKVQARAISKVLVSQKLATKADIGIIQKEMIAMEERLRREIAETKSELLKWVIGLLLAQTGIIIAVLKLIP